MGGKMKEIYDKNFYEHEGKSALSAAEILLPFIIDNLGCKSIVDFGCGTGEWLSVAKRLGCQTILGVDGAYVKSKLVIDDSEFVVYDLCKRIALQKKFDLAISLEVAEHISSDFADVFVENLISHSDVVLFSAAIPFQGGTHHVNEQYPSYWRKKFVQYDFEVCDCLRQIFWNDNRIEAFYRQNIFLYCRKEIKNDLKGKLMNSDSRLIDFIHPTIWSLRNTKQYFFPFSRILKNSKIVIYGAGIVGHAFLNQILATSFCDCVMLCDSSWLFFDYQVAGFKVSNPVEITTIEYDYIVIAVEKENMALDIRKYLNGLGIKNDLIIWECPAWKTLW